MYSIFKYVFLFTELNSRLFAIWAPYLEQVCKLADFFLRSYVRAIFRTDASTAQMEKGTFIKELIYLLNFRIG